MVPSPPSCHQYSRSVTLSPLPGQPLQAGELGHSPHPSQSGTINAAASPSAGSPTAGNSVTNIVITQVSVLLATLRDDTDRAKWEAQAKQLRKLIDENGMETFSKYFRGLVTQNAPAIFPALNRPAANTGNYHFLTAEMAKISRDVTQGSKIAESIEQGNEDIFRDFDLSTFMEHFKLDALEKTILALAFKCGTRADLKTKADAILSTNFPTFVNIISRFDGNHADLSSTFIASIVDRYIQGHPPNFNAAVKSELSHKVKSRWTQAEQAPPMEVMASLDLMRVLGEKPANALTLYIHKTGVDFTRDEEACLRLLQDRPASMQLTEEQVSSALSYTTISGMPRHNPTILVAALRRVVPSTFSWQNVVTYFDQRDVRVSPEQFLRLYNALLPVAQARDASLPPFDIQFLWGGSHWENPETQLSFICAFASLTPDELDASTIPGLQPTFTLEEYNDSPTDSIRQRAAVAVKHPLVSVAALTAIFQVALHSLHASQSYEAKRLFQEVVVPNLDIFIVSAFGVEKPWPHMAVDTLNNLFDRFLHRQHEYHDFVLDSLWRRDDTWVTARLRDAHASKPLDLLVIYEIVMEHGWLDPLAYQPTGLAFDLTARAHSRGELDLTDWARTFSEKSPDLAHGLVQYLDIKSRGETQAQKSSDPAASREGTVLEVKTVSAMLQILEDYIPSKTAPELIKLQRQCIIAYPRLINYGEGFDDIIDANGRSGNALPPQAIARMEEHYKTMYGNEVQVKDIVETLTRYKQSQDPLEQDVFTCMIHGLFDEYLHYVDYPLEALATTAVLFGGVIARKLISDLPLQVGLGMILEAVRDHTPNEAMYKFGLQASMQLLSRLREWPGFAKQLTQIPGLQGTEAWKKANEVVQEHEVDVVQGPNGGMDATERAAEALLNGSLDETHSSESHPPFSSVNVDPPPAGFVYEDPTVDIQDKVQFNLNNLTPAKLQTVFKEIEGKLEHKHQQWFASHLVEERAKMQPNYHQVYLDLLRQFQDKSLSAEVLRQTYISTAKMLNSESTMQNSTERTHLKHLGAWLGLLTIARDQPIKHRNIAFKQLLIDGHDTKRLIVVIPFICKVLIQGARSTVYRPPNPWLMDILRLLIELYHHAELKLNLKFEIEVLCKDLSLDHKNIEPSQELMNRAPIEDVVPELPVSDALETFDALSLNGAAGGVAPGLSPHPVPVSIPDFRSLLQIPPVNEMVAAPARLQEIVHTALTRALQDIIQPVVDRSVTIAAISTQQMIHKDFATEPDENRVRNCAINMVKNTAGSLALVTSKEPLRANITNYMRNLAGELPQGLPEGVIIMCVNSNLDIACNIIEKQAEERAIPEIEEMIEPELDARRRHRAQRPNEPYMDSGLSRWAMTIPHPYKLSPSMSGLNPEQMAIYEDFARQPRAAAQGAAQAHNSSASDATRNIANEVLQDQYSSVPALPTPAETPSLPHIPAQMPYTHGHQAATNGRVAPHPGQFDARGLADRVQKFLAELQRAATDSREEHFTDLPRPHQVLDVVDALTQLIIRGSQNAEEFAFFAAEKICVLLFSQIEQTLFLESLVHVLELLLKISATSGMALQERVHAIFYQQQLQSWLNLPLITALMRTELLNLPLIDAATSKALAQREEGSLDFFDKVLDLLLFNDRPVALFADFVRSLEAAWQWMSDEPDHEAAQRLKSKIEGSGLTRPEMPDDAAMHRQDQFEYVFEEWIRLLSSWSATEKTYGAFARQVRQKGIITNKEDFMIFVRSAIDLSVAQCDQIAHLGGSHTDAFTAVDALAKLIAVFAKENTIELGPSSDAAVVIFDAAFAIGAIVLNHHHVTRGEHFNQKVFFRYFSMLFHESEGVFDMSALNAVVGQDGIEVHRRDFVMKAANTLVQLAPVRFPGFVYGWLSLTQHRHFLPLLMNLENKRGWVPLTKMILSLLNYVSEHLKAVDIHEVARDFLRAVTKFFIVLQHDYPEYLAANHARLSAGIPPHAAQLRNLILFASPRQDSAEAEVSGAAGDYDSAVACLQDAGLQELVDQLLLGGPSEDAIAYLTHAIARNEAGTTVFGGVAISTNADLINAMIAYIGDFVVKRAQQEGNDLFIPGAGDSATLALLAHELGPEARYYLLSRIADELRYPSPSTTYFSNVLMDLWGQDMNDPDEIDLRQQLVRILLERFAGYWPHPWGLMAIIVELTKNQKYMFFEQPFIKADREIGEQFVQIVSNSAL